jgi:multiple sugar transport system substrate-binding protein
VENRPRISTLGMNRRSLVKSSLFAGGALAFAGFGRAPGVLAQDNIRLVQWYHQYGEEGTQAAVEGYAEQYTAENPNVEIEVVWQLGDYGAGLAAALLTDDGPDIFEQNSVTLDQVEQGQVAPLDDLYTDELKADFGEANLAAATINGSVYWVKMLTDTGGVYYKKSVFEENGITVPTNIDELIAATTTLGSGRTKGLFVGNDGGIGALGGPMLWSAGGSFLTADNKPGFNNERTANAWLKLKELNDTGALLMGSTTDYWDPSAFIQGATAMQWTGLWAFPAINEAVGDDLGVFAWPASDAEGTSSTFWGGWGECVSAKSANLDAAKAYVKWLWIDNTEVQNDWNVGYGFHVTPRESAAATAEALQVGAAADMVQNLYDYGVGNNPLWTPAMGSAYTDALTRVVRDGADPVSELASLEETVLAELERLLGS